MNSLWKKGLNVWANCGKLILLPEGDRRRRSAIGPRNPWS